MKFQTRFAKRQALIKKYSTWQSRYALLPRRISADTTVWLERYAIRVAPNADPDNGAVRVVVGRHEFIALQPEVKYEYSHIDVGEGKYGFHSYPTWWWRL